MRRRRAEEGSGQDRPIDLFISYSPVDERWATWIAWELETAGYSTILQAWDFVPGTNFIDFMDRGVSEATLVISVLSRNYLGSRYGRLEWQAALRADPDGVNRLVPVRVEDCPLEGLLSLITYLDLVGVSDPQKARALLLARIREALGGRARPDTRPGYPSPGGPAPGGPAPGGPAPGGLDGPPTPWPGPSDEPTGPPPSEPVARRRVPVAAPAYPPAAPNRDSARPAVSVLHVPGPRFGRGPAGDGAPTTAGELQAQIYGELTRLAGEGAPEPDLLVVTGDLTDTGSRREFAEATDFLTGLRVLLGIEPNRVIVVPGPHDITRSACQAYFATCEADDVVPTPPYWPKWRHFTRLFEELYQGLDDPVFDSQQPWTLFAVPDLRVVVAGLNSTINDSHREDDHYGWIGQAQADWFARHLQPFEQHGWLRIGVVRHVPRPVDSPDLIQDPALLQDSGALDRILGPRLSLMLHGPGLGGGRISRLGSGLLTVPAPEPGRYQLVQLTAAGLVRWSSPAGRLDLGSADDLTAGGARPERLAQRWSAVDATFTSVIGDQDQPTRDDAQPVSPEPVRRRKSRSRARLPEQVTNSLDAMLIRTAEIYKARGAVIERVDSSPPHLLVTLPEGVVVRQLRVAGHVGTPGRAEVDSFIRLANTADPDAGLEMVYDGDPPSRIFRDRAYRQGLRLCSLAELQR